MIQKEYSEAEVIVGTATAGIPWGAMVADKMEKPFGYVRSSNKTHGKGNKIEGKIAEKGYTLVPLKVYFKGSLVKVSIGLAKGKKLYDKRQDIAKKDMRREAEREFKVRNL